jgi:integrase/recombinase XerD
VVALWLGHESIETTQVYIHAPEARPGRYRPDDKLLAFLEAL